VFRRDLDRAGQVGNRSGDLQNPVVGSSTEPQFPHGELEGLLARDVQGAQRSDLAGRDIGIAVTAGQLALPGGQHPFPHLGRRLPTRPAAQFLIRNGGDFNVEIDAVEEGTADLGEVSLDDAGGAPAFAGRVAMKTARASVQIATDAKEANGEMQLSSLLLYFRLFFVAVLALQKNH
jgi:hypothetical protein